MISLHEGQSGIFADLFINKSARYATVCCTRGWGKSYLAATAAVQAVFELLELHKDVPHKVVYIIAPTYEQVVDIYMPLLCYELGLERYARKVLYDKARFIFARNVELRLVSYESVERLRGKGAYFIVLDEVSSYKKGLHPKEAWESVILPCMTTRWSAEHARRFHAQAPARALIIGTPKGYNFFYDMFNFRDLDVNWKSYHFDYTQAPFLDQLEVARMESMMDPISFASEYKALFQESGNSVFYCFDRKVNVRADLPLFGEHETIYFGIDFNVGIQATSVFALRGSEMHVLHEHKGHPDTEALAISLSTKYAGHKLVAFPDPTGKSRKTSAAVGRTDFSILESYGIQVVTRSSSPSIVDSAAAVNAMLKSARGGSRLFVRPECRGVIESLERTSWLDGRPDTATIDKKDGVEHFSDGIRYPVEYLFPIKRKTKVAVRGERF